MIKNTPYSDVRQKRCCRWPLSFSTELWIGAILLCLFKFPFKELEWLQNPFLWSICATAMLAMCLWKCRVTSWNICWICFIVWCVVGVLLGNPNRAFQSWQRVVYLCMGFSLLSPIIENQRIDMLRQHIWWCACAFVVIACLVSFLFLLKESWWNGVVTSGCFPGGLGLSHFSAMAAILGINIVMGYRLNLWMSLITYIYVALCIALLFAGGSRMGLLSLVIAIGALSIYYKNKGVVIFLSVIGGVAIVFLIYPELWYNLAHIIYLKFEGGVDHGSLTWSRDSLWAARWQEFMESPFYGVGLGSVRYFAYPWNNPEEILSHGHIEPGSSWLGVLSQTGIVGLFLLVIPMISIWAHVLRVFASNYADSVAVTLTGNLCSRIKIILKSVDSLQLQVAVFIICLIQSLTEGFILAPGSFHFTMFWVLLSRMKSACDSCDKVKPYYEHRVI